MNIVFSTDNLYVPYCGISIISLLENNKTKDINIYIVGHNLSSESKKILYKIGEKYNTIFQFIDINDDVLNMCPPTDLVKTHFTMAVYIRLFLASILPDVEKIIYLDSDIIIEQSLKELWNTDITEYALAGVVDLGIEYENKYFKGYFNSGILLINLDYWRKNDIEQKFFDYFKSGGIITHPDQDTMNYVLRDHVKYLPIKYNVQTHCYYSRCNFIDYEKEIEEAINDTVIIHYTGPQKPWHIDSTHPRKETFINYMELSEWNGKELLRGWSPYYSVKFHRRFRFYKRKILNKLGSKKSIYKDIK